MYICIFFLYNIGIGSLSGQAVVWITYSALYTNQKGLWKSYSLKKKKIGLQHEYSKTNLEDWEEGRTASLSLPPSPYLLLGTRRQPEQEDPHKVLWL